MSKFINFENLIDKEKNKSCLILGPSKSMLNFPFHKFDGKIICIGDSILRGKNYFNADYWIAANNEWPVPNYEPHLKIINSFKNLTFVFSETALYDNLWTKSRDFLDKNININWSVFDERHFNNQPCKKYSKCCELIDNNRITLQEYFTNKFKDSFYEITIADTVAEYALIFASLLGFNKIYIQGVDLPKEAKDYTYFKDLDVDDLILNTKKYIANEIKKKNSNMNLNKKITYFFNSYFNRLKYNLPIRHFKNKFTFINLISFIFRFFNKNSIFANDLEKILKNFDDIAKTLKNSNIDVINVNKNSSLRTCENLKFIDYEFLKNI